MENLVSVVQQLPCHNILNIANLFSLSTSDHDRENGYDSLKLYGITTLFLLIPNTKLMIFQLSKEIIYLCQLTKIA
jgi:hypothetical protein